MAIKIDGISITGVNDQDKIQRINTQLRALILTPEASLPGSRGFGLAYEFMDSIPPEAVNIFAIELEEKVNEFIPDISIAEVEAEAYGLGDIKIKIYVEGSDADDQGN